MEKINYKWVKEGGPNDCEGCYWDSHIGGCPIIDNDPDNLECIEVDGETGEEIFYKYMED